MQNKMSIKAMIIAGLQVLGFIFYLVPTVSLSMSVSIFGQSISESESRGVISILNDYGMGFFGIMALIIALLAIAIPVVMNFVPAIANNETVKQYKKVLNVIGLAAPALELVCLFMAWGRTIGDASDAGAILGITPDVGFTFGGVMLMLIAVAAIVLILVDTFNVKIPGVDKVVNKLDDLGNKTDAE